MSLDLTELRKANVARLPAFGHDRSGSDWSSLEWAAAMCGESGEAANVAKKIKRLDTTAGAGNHAGESDRAALVRHLADEIADVIVYADLLAHSEGIDLAEAVARKFNEVSVRVGSRATIASGEG